MGSAGAAGAVASLGELLGVTSQIHLSSEGRCLMVWADSFERERNAPFAAQCMEHFTKAQESQVLHLPKLDMLRSKYFE